MVNMDRTFFKLHGRITRDYVGYPSDIYLSLYVQNILIITTTSALLSGMIKISNLFPLVESQTSGTVGIICYQCIP